MLQATGSDIEGRRAISAASAITDRVATRGLA
jgi:hypothetical protein